MRKSRKVVPITEAKRKPSTAIEVPVPVEGAIRILTCHRTPTGAPHFLSRYLPIPFVNAGDGTHEHPTQALLDALTILDRRGTLENLRVAIIGDIAHSRVARSNIFLLSKFGVQVVLCGPASLLPGEMTAIAPGVELTTNMETAIRDVDVIMMLRVQLERQHEAAFPANEYFRFYGLRLEHMELAKPNVIVMHP